MAVQKTASSQRRVKPADVGTRGSNKRTARLLAQAKKQGQADNPRITARELESIITKTGGSDVFLRQTGAMASLKNDLGPLAKKKYDALVADYATKNRRSGDDTPQAPAGMSPVIPGQPRSSMPTSGGGLEPVRTREKGAYASQLAPGNGARPAFNPVYSGPSGRGATDGKPNLATPGAYASQLAPGNGARPAFNPVYSGPSGRGATDGKPNRANQVAPGTQEQSDNPKKFLDSFIGVSPKFRNIGNPDVQVEGMSVGNIRMRR